MFNIEFNNKSNLDFGLMITRRPSIPSPEENVLSYELPGVNGSYTQKLGTYKPIVIPIEFNLISLTELQTKVRAIKGWLNNIVGNKLIFSDDVGFYYKVKNVIVPDIARKISISGEFTASFQCDPFIYEDVSPVTITEETILVNLGTVYAEPIIRVNGTGNITLSIGNKNIILNNVEEYIVIDGVMKNAYKGTVSLNDKMNGEYPRFEIGNNDISWVGNVSSLVIEPNWRYL